MKQKALLLPCTKPRQAAKPVHLSAKLNNPGEGKIAFDANPAVADAAASSKRVAPAAELVNLLQVC